MPDHTVTPLRPRAAAGYTDTAALNDIHALITSQVPADTTFTDLALILARTAGRWRVRDIEITATETADGLPVACARSGGTSVLIRQELAGPGLLIVIAATTPAERGALTVTLDGATLHPACPLGPADGRAVGQPPPRKDQAPCHLLLTPSQTAPLTTSRLPSPIRRPSRPTPTRSLIW